jgi:hypothetical protein
VSDWLTEYKMGLSCEICGDERHYVLVFHHECESDKVSDVASLASEGYSIETVKREIAKCRVLCANCHRELHWRERVGVV